MRENYTYRIKLSFLLPEQLIFFPAILTKSYLSKRKLNIKLN